MSDIDDRMKAYKQSLQRIEASEKTRYDHASELIKQFIKHTPGALNNYTVNMDEIHSLVSGGASIAPRLVSAQVDFSGDARLKSLDQQFIRLFSLEEYLPTELLAYPTVFCETLEEFFTPITTMLNLSQDARQQHLKRYIADAKENSSSGGIYGFNLPGKGCYLNGWLFAVPSGLTPRQVLEKPELQGRVFQTAVHEKLGHGFLDVFSSLGKVNSALGSYMMRLAAEFGLAQAADAIDHVRQEQYKVLFDNFILTQEGWATWIETLFGAKVISIGNHPKHSLPKILAAVENIPGDTEQWKAARKNISTAIGMILDDNQYPAHELMKAVEWIHKVNEPLSDYFSSILGQPLCYALGEMIMMKAEVNLGLRCVPFAVLIAANITFDPEKLSLSDMRELFTSKIDMNPDARMVLVSKLKLDEPGNVHELANKAESQLSFQVPGYMK